MLKRLSILYELDLLMPSQCMAVLPIVVALYIDNVHKMQDSSREIEYSQYKVKIPSDLHGSRIHVKG